MREAIGQQHTSSGPAARAVKRLLELLFAVPVIVTAVIWTELRQAERAGIRTPSGLTAAVFFATPVLFLYTVIFLAKHHRRHGADVAWIAELFVFFMPSYMLVDRFLECVMGAGVIP